MAQSGTEQKDKRELAPGATTEVMKLLEGKTVEFVSVVKVRDSYADGFYAYQPLALTVKDGKVIYAAYVGDQVPTIEDAINEATSWVDTYFYGID